MPHDIYLDDSSDEEKESESPYNLVQSTKMFTYKYANGFFQQQNRIKKLFKDTIICLFHFQRML